VFTVSSDIAAQPQIKDTKYVLIAPSDNKEHKTIAHVIFLSYFHKKRKVTTITTQFVIPSLFESAWSNNSKVAPKMPL
jgi:hypothetical protein